MGLWQIIPRDFSTRLAPRLSASFPATLGRKNAVLRAKDLSRARIQSVMG
jgi:hypothetical protein